MRRMILAATLHVMTDQLHLPFPALRGRHVGWALIMVLTLTACAAPVASDASPVGGGGLHVGPGGDLHCVAAGDVDLGLGAADTGRLAILGGGGFAG